MQVSHDWSWFYVGLVEKMARIFNQSKRVVKQNRSKHNVTFDTKLKAALSLTNHNRQPTQRTNQNSEQTHVTGANAGKGVRQINIIMLSSYFYLKITLSDQFL